MANFTGEYSISTRRNVNNYCQECGLEIFGFWEYFKSWFPRIFPEDKIKKEFNKKYLFISGDKKNISIATLERCVIDIFKISKYLIADGGYNTENRERIMVDFRRENLYGYEFFSLIRTKKDRDNIYHEFDKVLRLMVTKTYLEAKDIFELSKLIYRIILVYEKNITRIDDILKSAKDIGMRYTVNKHKVREDADLFKDSFKTLITFYKRQLYPIILKNINSYFGKNDNENNESKDKMYLIYELLEIVPENIFTYEGFTAEQERLKRLREEIKQMENQEIDSIKESFKDSVSFMSMLYPNSGISNILEFEFILPYFIKNLIKNEDLKLEREELGAISKEDPAQIVVSIFSIIWYNFLISFDIGNEPENSQAMNELGVIKTRWQRYFGVFKKYFEKLLDYKKETSIPRKETLERMLYEVKSQIFYINSIKNPDSLSDFLKELVLFLNTVEANKTRFFIWSKSKKDEKMNQEDSVNVFSNYKKLIETFEHLLVDRNSFFADKINKTSIGTDFEKTVLAKYKLI